MKGKRKCLAVIRVRGLSDVFREIDETLRMLHLTRNCHATLIDDRPSYLGMLRKAKDYLVWGEVSKEVVALLLRKRGRLVGDKTLTEQYVQGIGYESIDDLAEAIYELRVEYGSLSGVKPVFRLHPPKKGFRGKVKKSYAAGGVTGYRSEVINDLIKRMA
ncbi:MAG: 50S ribosomal protein L30 [Candidatus Bathyarchaeota archaeon]|nr:MAG: 50S ribosomal protein L30 [Candidatus Bathyarchaeota archaeon]